MTFFETIIEYGKQKDKIAKDYKENKISHHIFCILNEENEKKIKNGGIKKWNIKEN